ncbi:hypothetical protein AB0O31_28010 [Kitasatospora cineracea]|uniref:hypothetical protein n=1 Tax=Kitasatospora cineracea TaxID=88074 RepID=UPI003420AA4B
MDDGATGSGSRLLVSRDRTRKRDKWRAYRVLVDGVVVGKVRRGGSVAVEVPTGRHMIQVKIDWCGSPKVLVTVGTGREYRMKCGPRLDRPHDLSLITTDLDNYL